MEPIGVALAEEQAGLTDLLAGRSDDDWRRPSRCEGWTVADVVLHLAQTNELAVASAQDRFSQALNELTGGPANNVDDGADLMVARDRGSSASAISERWSRSVAALTRALEACAPSKRVIWVAGELSAQTLATTRLAETWIHSGDVAAAFGVVQVASDRLWHIARLAWRTLPYAFAREGRELTGPVQFDLQSPGGESWRFDPDAEPLTTVTGASLDLCLLAARRVGPSETGLRATGPDADAVLAHIRTYA